MKIYISGPMTGKPAYNLPAFAAAAEQLKAHGFEAVNPGVRGVIDGYTWRDYMRDAVALIFDCDGMALLDDWHESRGARIENELAHGLGMPVKYLEQWWA